MKEADRKLLRSAIRKGMKKNGQKPLRFKTLEDTFKALFPGPWDKKKKEKK